VNVTVEVKEGSYFPVTGQIKYFQLDHNLLILFVSHFLDLLWWTPRTSTANTKFCQISSASQPTFLRLILMFSFHLVLSGFQVALSKRISHHNHEWICFIPWTTFPSHCHLLDFNIVTVSSTIRPVKSKGKVIPLHAMEAFGVRGGTAPTHT
jgi:hypothetical protein